MRMDKIQSLNIVQEDRPANKKEENNAKSNCWREWFNIDESHREGTRE